MTAYSEGKKAPLTASMERMSARPGADAPLTASMERIKMDGRTPGEIDWTVVTSTFLTFTPLLLLLLSLLLLIRGNRHRKPCYQSA